MGMNKSRIVILLWLLISLALWIFDFRIISFILLAGGWIVLIKDDSVGKRIKKTLLAGFFFIIFWIVSQFRIFELSTDFDQPCWSPDGKQIAFFMHKHLARRWPGPLGWTGKGIWDKYYLCAMDYDGKNFKIEKEIKTELPTRKSGYVAVTLSWTNKENITMTSSDPNVDVYTFNLPTKEIKKIYTLAPPKDISGGRTWLSPSGQYLVINYYPDKSSAADIGKGILIYDLDNKKVLQDIKKNFAKELHGSYSRNAFTFFEDDEIMVGRKVTFRKQYFYDIKTNTLTERSLPLEKGISDYLDGFEYRSLSPDRSMYADEGRGVASSAVAIRKNTEKREVVTRKSVKDKRSYLFNIFGE